MRSVIVVTDKEYGRREIIPVCSIRNIVEDPDTKEVTIYQPGFLFGRCVKETFDDIYAQIEGPITDIVFPDDTV